jgi:aminopeptidase
MVMDPRIRTLAHSLLTYSLDLAPGQKLLIEGDAGCEPLVEALMVEAYRLKLAPFFALTDSRLERAWLLGATEEQFEERVQADMVRIQGMDGRLYIGAGYNGAEAADIPAAAQQGWARARKAYMDTVKRTKWCTLRYPTASAAQAAGMSTEAYEDFCLSVSCLDYSRMQAAMDPLVALMNGTDLVRITGPGTDLTFSLEGIPTVKSPGHFNIPDGEVSTAPVLDSAEGVITYNVPSRLGGVTYQNVSLTLRHGRIVEAHGTPQDRLRALLDTDGGSRFLGEFSLGVNPGITRPVGDILFDEKMTGSLHVTPGDAYEVIDNGNRSALHWDLVLLQTPEWGGGDIWFDGVLVRRDGRFVLPELYPLNPENLI